MIGGAGGTVQVVVFRLVPEVFKDEPLGWVLGDFGLHDLADFVFNFLHRGAIAEQDGRVEAEQEGVVRLAQDERGHDRHPGLDCDARRSARNLGGLAEENDGMAVGREIAVGQHHHALLAPEGLQDAARGLSQRDQVHAPFAALLFKEPVDFIEALRQKHHVQAVAERGHDGAPQLPVAEVGGDQQRAAAQPEGLLEMHHVLDADQAANFRRRHARELEEVHQVFPEIPEGAARHLPESFLRGVYVLGLEDLREVGHHGAAAPAVLHEKPVGDPHREPVGEPARQPAAEDLRDAVGQI